MVYIGVHERIKSYGIYWRSVKIEIGTLKFKHGSQWENPKMCNVLKTADRTKIWD